MPPWVVVEDTPDWIPFGSEQLQAGECAAILLAKSIRADRIIIDEKAARLIAGERTSMGLLGVIGEAAMQGLPDLTQVL